MKLHFDRSKVRVRKVRSVWIADCPGCPVAVGFVMRPTHGLALAWALSHIKAHKGLTYVERESVYK